MPPEPERVIRLTKTEAEALIRLAQVVDDKANDEAEAVVSIMDQVAAFDGLIDTRPRANIASAQPVGGEAPPGTPHPEDDLARWLRAALLNINARRVELAAAGDWRSLAFGWAQLMALTRELRTTTSTIEDEVRRLFPAHVFESLDPPADPDPRLVAVIRTQIEATAEPGHGEPTAERIARAVWGWLAEGDPA